LTGSKNGRQAVGAILQTLIFRSSPADMTMLGAVVVFGILDSRARALVARMSVESYHGSILSDLENSIALDMAYEVG